MKEVLANQISPEYNNYFATNNGDSSHSAVNSGSETRRYAVISTEWISAIGEELGLHPLPDPLLRRLAEDASYRLREVLHKCVTRLKHSRRKKLTAADVNKVLTTLCDVDPVPGAPAQLPEYHSEARVFVPCERIINLVEQASDVLDITQTGAPFITETEQNNPKLEEVRLNYAKRALKTLFNGSQKTFQVLLNDCATNVHLGGLGLVDKLISIARASIISTNAQYTRVATRTCQLIIAIASNSVVVYPHRLDTVDKLTELLLESLFGKSIINPNLELLFKEAVIKLMLRWPTTAHRFMPMLEGIFIKPEADKSSNDTKQVMAMEIITGVQPLSIFQCVETLPYGLKRILPYASSGTVLWQQLALSVCALSKSSRTMPDSSLLNDHYGDSILPYLSSMKHNSKTVRSVTTDTPLPIIVRSKIKYVNIKPVVNIKITGDKQAAFPDSTLRGPRREIRFAFAGGRPVPPSNLRRASLRANYQILRSDIRASFALVASRRLLVVKNKKPSFVRSYDLANINL